LADKNISEGTIIYIAIVLEYKQVLLAYVSSALYVSHPGGRVFVAGIDIVT